MCRMWSSSGFRDATTTRIVCKSCALNGSGPSPGVKLPYWPAAIAGMDPERSYILFCPPYLPLRLSGATPAVIGRA